MFRIEKTVFSIGFLIGVIIACLLVKSENETSIETNCEVKDRSLIEYEDWFSDRKLKRTLADYDILSYGHEKENNILESKFLFNVVNVQCVVFVKKAKSALAIKNTWGKHCNSITFFSTENITDVSVILLKPKSSWQYLCDAMQYIWTHYRADVQWVLFAPDDLYVIPENLRHFVAHLDYKKPYYFGSDVTFWGQLYNVKEAGYVLSKGAIAALQKNYNTSDACLKSGKYWKNEDFYLGKYLNELDILPVDSSDKNGCPRFHRYNLHYVRGSATDRLSKQINAGCFGEHTISFNGIESDKFYLYYYLLYHVKVFSRGGSLGNHPPASPDSEDEVWRKFVREEGLSDTEYISSNQYYQLWQHKIPSPEVLNAYLRQQSQDAFSSEGMSGPSNK